MQFLKRVVSRATFGVLLFIGVLLACLMTLLGGAILNTITSIGVFAGAMLFLGVVVTGIIALGLLFINGNLSRRLLIDQEEWDWEDEDEEKPESEAERPLFAGLTVSKSATGVGRNQPCPCESGKKYKMCCLQKDEQENSGQEAIPF